MKIQTNFIKVLVPTSGGVSIMHSPSGIHWSVMKGKFPDQVKAKEWAEKYFPRAKVTLCVSESGKFEQESEEDLSWLD